MFLQLLQIWARVDKAVIWICPDDSATIWHLIAVRPTNKGVPSILILFPSIWNKIVFISQFEMNLLPRKHLLWIYWSKCARRNCKIEDGNLLSKISLIFRCTFHSWHLAFLLPERWMGAIFVGEGNCSKFRLKLAMHPKFYVVACPARWIMLTYLEF